MSTADFAGRDGWSSLPGRIGRCLTARKPTDAARRGLRAVSSAYREWRLGIRTCGSIESQRLHFDSASFGYQPIPYASFDAALKHIHVRAGRDVFVDYGCGMGRAVVLAALHPFRQVIGVERSAQLCAMAMRNVRAASKKLRCPHVQIECADARRYRIPPEASLVFMFNPFDEPIVRTVLAGVRESLDHHPRDLAFIYGLPKCRCDVLREVPWLRARAEIETIDSDWQRLVVYEVR